jgi:pantetheine-phosphate adenylyltransferase
MVTRMNVCLGGTFYPLHKGHKKLLKRAIELAGVNGSIFIGITSDRMTEKKGRIASFEKRKKSIEQFLSEEGKRAIIQSITDKFGPSIDGDYDAIVVSPETKPTADEINKKRKQLGKKPLRIVVIPFVLSEDNQPISSSRIRLKEIDVNGTLLKQE